MNDHIPVYYDPKEKLLYYIKWTESGNNDIPERIYLNLTVTEIGQDQL